MEVNIGTVQTANSQYHCSYNLNLWGIPFGIHVIYSGSGGGGGVEGGGLVGEG